MLPIPPNENQTYIALLVGYYLEASSEAAQVPVDRRAQIITAIMRHSLQGLAQDLRTRCSDAVRATGNTAIYGLNEVETIGAWQIINTALTLRHFT